MRTSPLKMLRLICLLTVVGSASLAPQTSSLASDKTRKSSVREGADVDRLERLLSAAIEAKGGLARLKGLKDEYSAARIVYGDVYRTEVLFRTWRMDPDFFRQDMLRDNVILRCQQYDGERFLEGFGQRVRFGLEKDLNTLLENAELNKILSLLPIGTDSYPARLGERTRHNGGWLQEVLVEAPSGLTCGVHFDEQTCLISKLEYVERSQYAQGMEVHPMVTYIDSYRTVDGVLVANRLRIHSGGALKAEVRLVEHRFNVGLSADFFSIDSLRRTLAENPPGSTKITTTATRQQEWKESVLRKISELLETHRGCRFREVASYGNPGIYRERLLGSDLTFVVDPNYLEDDDALAFYAELVPAPSGFYEDCIVLADPPQSTYVSAKLLLHETTHAILRQRQEEAPLMSPDDEYLTHYQGDLFSLGQLLDSFERITLNGTLAKEPEVSDRAAGTWRAARHNLREIRRRGRMTPEALEQFREWCGVDFDLNRIRQHYLHLGVDPKWMPMD